MNNITHVTCNGANDGTITRFIKVPTLDGIVDVVDLGTNLSIPNLNTPFVSPAGATLTPVVGGLQFDTNGTFGWDALPAGKYRITVTDSTVPDICTGIYEFEITEPDTLAVDYNIVPGLCGDSTVTIQATAEGGTPGYSFELENVGSGYGPIIKTSGEFKNVPLDNTNPYTLTVTDDNGCTANTSFLVDSTGGLELSAGFTNVTCYGVCNGTITAVGTGGVQPYRFILTSDPAGTYTKSSDCDAGTCVSSHTFTGLCAGDYKVKVVDANGCIFEYPDTITITQPTQIDFTGLAVTDATCNFDGSIVIDTITGGTGPYTVKVTSSPEGQVVPSTIFTDGASVAVTYSNLISGNYEITITDSTGCTRIVEIGINDSPQVII